MILGREPISFTQFGENDGLAFSTEPTSRIGSLRDLSFFQQNLILELWTDQKLERFRTTSLRKWTKQGVLLWNYLPTTKQKFPLAHNTWGWHHLSDEIIETVWLYNPKTVFMVWGGLNFDLHEILPEEAIIIETPSPFTMHPEGSWFGSSPFSRCNKILEDLGEKPINWSL
jgi:uracil-DNA glycosylase